MKICIQNMWTLKAWISLLNYTVPSGPMLSAGILYYITYLKVFLVISARSRTHKYVEKGNISFRIHVLSLHVIKFLSWNMANTLILFAEKYEWLLHSHFCSKTINVFENALATTVNESVINELVKLTMLWTTGPWFDCVNVHAYLGLLCLHVSKIPFHMVCFKLKMSVS